MKKLMFAAAVAAATVGYCSVESANVVGYAPTALAANGNVGAGCFIPVGAEGVIDLTQITVKGYEGDTKAALKVYLLDEDGATSTTAMYSWYDYYDTKTSTQMTGWMLGRNWVKEGDVPFQAGEGLWVTAPSANFKLQSSGQVLKALETAEVVLENGAGMLVANPTPVTVDLTKCSVTGYTGDTKAAVKAYVLDEDGATATTAMYSWYDYYDTKTSSQMTGWMLGRNWIKEGDVPMLPGKGLWVTTNANGFKFVFPGVSGL